MAWSGVRLERFEEFYFYTITLVVIYMLMNFSRVYLQLYFPDIPNYREMFGRIPKFNLKMDLEKELVIYDFSSEFGGKYESPVDKGFLLSVSIFKNISTNFHHYLWFVFTLQYFSVLRFAHYVNLKFTTVIPVYMALTFVTFQIGMLRQSIAAMLFLYCFNERNVVVLVAVFMGFYFHKSILFLLPLVLLWNVRYSFRVYLYLGISSILVYLLRIDILQLLIGVIDSFLSLGIERFLYYLSVNRLDNYLGIGFIDRIFQLSLLLVLLFMARGQELSRSNIRLVNSSVYLLIFQFLFYSSPTILSRIRYFLVFFPLLTIMILFSYTRFSSNRMLFDILIIPYLLLQSFVLLAYLK